MKRFTFWTLSAFIFSALLGFSSTILAEEGKWTRKADIPTVRAWFSTSVVNGKIYAIGGWLRGIAISSVEVYDPMTDTWTKKADMPTARGWFSTSVVNGKIYAIGGWDGSRALSTVEVYDPMTDTWTKKADMPNPREGHSASAVNGKVYLIGGILGPLSFAVEEYDPLTDTWTKKADMPNPRGYLADNSPVVNGKIYVIGGGLPGRSTVEEYDPVTDRWTKKADMPTPRGYLAMSEVNGKIYVFGGAQKFDLSAYLSTVEEYNLVTDTWMKKADMPTARLGLSASAVNGYIYAIGGRKGGGEFPPIVEEYDTGMGIRVIKTPPREGRITGGEPFAMFGSGFPPGAIVTIGEKPLADLKVTDTLITGITPPGTEGAQNIWIKVPGLGYDILGGKFIYLSLSNVVVTSITPTNGKQAGGDKGTIIGSGFLPGAKVMIGTAPATDVVITSTQILFTIPPGTEGAKDVVIINPDGQKGRLSGGYTYNPPPTIKRISPIFLPQVPSIIELTIEGAGFIRTPSVLVGGVSARRVDFISANELKILPSPFLAAGPSDVVVTNPDGQRAILPNGVTALAPIKIKSIEPNSGGLEGGTKITIVGEDFVVLGQSLFKNSRFVEGAEVIIGKEKASEVTVVSDNIITSITPPNTSGPKMVEVINPDGQSARLIDAFSYNPLPQIIKVIPNNGPLSGGAKITIQGSKFLPGAKVLIGDVDANSYIVASAPEVESDAFITAITPKIPLDEPGPRDVIVVNADGQEVVLRDGYRYNPFPTIRDLSPSYGPSSGGTKIIIRGTGFLQGARAIIGKNVAVTSVKDDETIEAVTPSNPKGVLDVKVLNPDTQEAVIPRAFVSVGELAYNYPNPFQASRGTTFRYVPGPNESVESIVVRIFNLAGVPIGVVGQEGSNEVRWQDSRVNVGLYVYMMEVRVGGKVKRFKRALEVYK